jgi:hypothetical protein
MNPMAYLMASLLALSPLTGCDRDKPAPVRVPVTSSQPTTQAPRANQKVATSDVTGTPEAHRPIPLDNESNRAMIRAAKGPKIKLLPCSTMTGEEYKECVATNAATIRAAAGR